MERAMHALLGMQIAVDTEHAAVLREVLENQLKELRIESARADSHDYRLQLHGREHILEDVLAQLGSSSPGIH
jgi:chemotaxis protein histidine kinase CheA